MQPSRRRFVVLVVIGGLLWAGRHWWLVRSDPPDVPRSATPWPPVANEPSLPDAARGGTVPAAAAVVEVSAHLPPGDAPGPARWVGPIDGGCPESHPVKAEMRSRIYHSPGTTAYNRTVPDRCYRNGDDAEADGFRSALH